MPLRSGVAAEELPLRGAGGAGVWAYMRDVWRLRYFWMALVRTDLRSRYRRSMIGVGWSLLHPIAMTIVLCTVFSQLFQMDVRTYGPYLLAGLVTWNFMIAALNQGCHCFFAGESYIRQYPAPLAIYPLRTVLGAGIHFLLGLAVVLVFVWAVNGPSNLPSLVSLVPTLALLFVFGWSLAVCSGVTNVLFQDTQHLTEVAVQILFYVTPIIYSADLLRQRHMAWFVELNPLASFIELIRKPILEGQVPAASVYANAGITSLVLAAAATLILTRIERRIIFYL
jgi:lipopolysaccharide transport system permease protein